MTATNRPTRLVVFAHARSGSTTLARALGQHPDLSFEMEPFNPRRGQKGRVVYHDRVRSIDQLDGVLDEIFSSCNAIKHLEDHFPVEINKQLLEGADVIVILRRRNLLRAAVSNELALQTGIWQPGAARRPRRQPGDVSIEQVRHTVASYRSVESTYLPYAKRCEARTIDVEYEDLFDASVSLAIRLERYHDLLRRIGVAPDDIVEPQEVSNLFGARSLNSEATYREIPNIVAVEEALAGPHGSVFDP